MTKRLILAPLLAACSFTPTNTMTDSAVIDGDASEIRFDIDAGSLTILVKDVETITLQRSWSWSGDLPSAIAQVDGDALILDVDCRGDQTCSVDHELHIPTSMAVSGFTGAGRIRIADLDDPIDVITGAGGIEVHRVDADVSVDTGSGLLGFIDITGDIVGHTGSGAITAEGIDSAHVDLTTGSGALDLTLVTAPSDVRAHTGSGDIRLELPEGAYAFGTHTGSGSIDLIGVQHDPAAQSTIDLHSGSGDIDVIGR
jgi:hypothetical protein